MTKEELLDRIKKKIGTGGTHYAGCEDEHILCACHKLIAELDDRDLFVIAEIRAALGVGDKPMLSELPEIARQLRLNAERYEKVRKLTPREISGLWLKGLRTNRLFDELVDALAITCGKEENP